MPIHFWWWLGAIESCGARALQLAVWLREDINTSPPTLISDGGPTDANYSYNCKWLHSGAVLFDLLKPDSVLSLPLPFSLSLSHAPEWDTIRAPPPLGHRIWDFYQRSGRRQLRCTFVLHYMKKKKRKPRLYYTFDAQLINPNSAKCIMFATTVICVLGWIQVKWDKHSS